MACDWVFYVMWLLVLMVFLQLVILVMVIVDRGTPLPPHLTKLFAELETDEVERLINFGQYPSTFPTNANQSGPASPPANRVGQPRRSRRKLQDQGPSR